MITSRRNPRIQELRTLAASARERVEAGLVVVEGLRCVETALRYGAEPLYLLVGAPSREPALLADLISTCDATWPECEICDTDREVLAWASSVQSQVEAVGVFRHASSSLADLEGGRVSRVLLLEDVGDPGNVGSCIRSAAAFGVDAVVLGGHCADWSNPKVIRGSAGTVFALPVVSVPSVREAVEVLRLPALGAVTGASLSLYEAGPRQRFALLLGSEVRGLSEEARACCEELVAIPMARGVESLNVSAAAAVCLSELCRP